MNLVSVKASQEYIEAKEATTEIEPPFVGFAVPSEYSAGPLVSSKAIIKQNNTILYLLIKQGQEISSIRESLIKIQKNVETLGKQESKPLDFNSSISDLTKRLDNFTISGGKVPPKSKQGPIYVFKDPNKIFEEQFAKEKK